MYYNSSANTLIAVGHLTRNIFRQHLRVIFTALLMTHFTSNYYHTYYQKWHGLAAYSPHFRAVIQYHTHFLLTIYYTCRRSNGVNTGPMKHWLTFLNNTNPI